MWRCWFKLQSGLETAADQDNRLDLLMMHRIPWAMMNAELRKSVGSCKDDASLEHPRHRISRRSTLRRQGLTQVTLIKKLCCVDFSSGVALWAARLFLPCPRCPIGLCHKLSTTLLTC